MKQHCEVVVGAGDVTSGIKLGELVTIVASTTLSAYIVELNIVEDVSGVGLAEVAIIVVLLTILGTYSVEFGVIEETINE